MKITPLLIISFICFVAGPALSQSSDEKIRQAMSAGPAAISKDATILEWPNKEGAEPSVIRKGTNAWTCFPDWPVSPGLDPMCFDKPSMEWTRAYMKKQAPKIPA